MIDYEEIYAIMVIHQIKRFQELENILNDNSRIGVIISGKKPNKKLK